MTSIITSDIHLGCKYLDPARFVAWLEALPPGAEVILNGDVVDRSHKVIPRSHQLAWDRLVAEAEHRHVVWVQGNHDGRGAPGPTGAIKRVDHYAIGTRLFIGHGHHFDNIMPYHRWFIHLVRTIHAVRIVLGADSVHVARYAKRFPSLYGVLRNHVARNAIQHAKENGFEAVACGHTHAAEQRTIDGIRYFNTGAWTEESPHVLVMTKEALLFRRIEDRS